MAMKIFITGGCGQCGSALATLPQHKVFFDRKQCSDDLNGFDFIQGDLQDASELTEAMDGCKFVIHLAAASETNSSWDEVLKSNIIGTKNILDAAKLSGVDRVIYASTNHVVGMYELDNAPEIYELGYKKKLTRDAEIRPDSLYGVSKAFGEQLGRYYSEIGGPKFYAVRIGALVREDHPYAHAERGVLSGKWSRNSPQYDLMVKRLKSLWISKRDFRQLITLCLYYDGPSFDIFYGVSDNHRKWLDIEYARTALGYKPQDNAEIWRYPP
jgi:nucleoside-diphosphate-sugar epimerase